MNWKAKAQPLDDSASQSAPAWKSKAEPLPNGSGEPKGLQLVDSRVEIGGEQVGGPEPGQPKGLDLPRQERSKAANEDEGSPSWNLIRGAGERAGELAGGLFRAGNELAEYADEQMPLGGFVWKDGDIIPSYLKPDEYREYKESSGRKEPLDIAADYWSDSDLGYVPESTWEGVKQEFGENGALSGSAWAEVLGFGIEQGARSIPDMVAVTLNLPGYVMARSGEIGEVRAQNKGKEEADLTDVLEATPFALGSALFERFGVKGFTQVQAEQFGKEALKRGVAYATGRIASQGGKAGGREGMTEFVQEGIIEYAGERLGTGKEMTLAEGVDRGLGGAVGGGVYGTVAGSSTQAGQEAKTAMQKPGTGNQPGEEGKGGQPLDDTPILDPGAQQVAPQDPGTGQAQPETPQWKQKAEPVTEESAPTQPEQPRGLDLSQQPGPMPSDFSAELEVPQAQQAEQEPTTESQLEPEQQTMTDNGTGVFRVPVDQIQVDPQQYQFRSRVNDQGVDQRLSGVQRWDDNRAGAVLLHRRNDGSLFVADGHHRVDLARRLGQGEINARIVNESDGVDVAGARVEAAMNNIADGKAEPVDVAKVFRDSDVPTTEVRKTFDLPSSQVVRDGESLAGLGDNVFGMVTAGQLSEKDGAAIGRSFEQEGRQEAAADAFQRVEPQTEYQRQLLINEIRAAEFAEAQGEQGGLFGDDAQEVSLMQDRLKVLDSLRQRLNSDKRLFKSLNDNADRASEAGNQIATEANEGITEQSARTLDLIGRVTTTPVLNDMVNRAARRVYDGEKRADVVKDLKRELMNHEQGANEPGGGRPDPAQSGRATEAPGQKQRASERVPEPDAAGADQGGQPEGVTPALDLQAQTEQDLAEQERQRQRAEQAEAARRREEEQRAQADAEADDFTLTGSDSPIDQAEARGQGNMFDQPEGTTDEQAGAEQADNLSSRSDSEKSADPEPSMGADGEAAWRDRAEDAEVGVQTEPGVTPKSQPKKPQSRKIKAIESWLDGARTGDKITLDGDVGYASAGQEYTVGKIDDSGVEVVGDRGRTSLSYGEVLGAQRNGVTVQKVGSGQPRQPSEAVQQEQAQKGEAVFKRLTGKAKKSAETEGVDYSNYKTVISKSERARLEAHLEDQGYRRIQDKSGSTMASTDSEAEQVSFKFSRNGSVEVSIARANERHGAVAPKLSEVIPSQLLEDMPSFLTKDAQGQEPNVRMFPFGNEGAVAQMVADTGKELEGYQDYRPGSANQDGTINTAERLMHELVGLRESVKTQNSQLFLQAKKGTKVSATESGLLSEWVKLKQAQNTLENSKKNHPEQWRAYDQRQKDLKKLRKGDKVHRPYTSPSEPHGSIGVVERRNPKNWRVTDSETSPNSSLIPVEALAPEGSFAEAQPQASQQDRARDIEALKGVWREIGREHPTVEFEAVIMRPLNMMDRIESAFGRKESSDYIKTLMKQAEKKAAYTEGQKSATSQQDSKPARRRPGKPELWDELSKLSEKARELPIDVSADDVSYQSARDAYSGISFSPDGRAIQEQMEYLQEMLSLHDRMSKLADTEEKQATLSAELQRYKANYLKHNSAVLAAKSRTMSTMITGGSKFPAQRNQKRLNAEHKRVEEFLAWRDKAQKSIAKKLTPESAAISSTDSDAISKLRAKLDGLEQAQSQMKAANKIARNKKLDEAGKIQQLQDEAGLSDAMAREILEPDFAGRVGFPSYSLSNNNAEIRRVKKRIEELEARKEVAGAVGGLVSADFDGGTVELDYNAGYVRILHDEKPGADVRKAMKGAGFRWTPSETAWRRKLNNQSMWKAEQLTGADLSTAQKQAYQPDSSNAGNDQASSEISRNSEKDPYESLETRPDTQQEQINEGRSALQDLFRQLNNRYKRNGLLGADGGEISLLGARIYKNFQEGKPNQLIGNKVQNPRDLAALAQVYRDPRFETFRFILTKKGEVVSEQGITSRLPASVAFDGLDSIVGDLKRTMADTDADGYYMLHNHPSGKSGPSKADIDFTRKVASRVGGFIDHVVVDTNEYSVISAEGAAYTKQDESLQSADFWTSPEKPHDLLGFRINDPKKAASAAKQLQEPGRAVLIGTSAKLDVTLISSMPYSMVEKLSYMTPPKDRREAVAALRRMFRASGSGGRGFVVVETEQQARNLSNLMRDGIVVDIATPEGFSLAQAERVRYQPNFMDRIPKKSLRVGEGEAEFGQTKTDAFREWFGDSKVVDDGGNPLIVYHGTRQEFDVFDMSRTGENTPYTEDDLSGAHFHSDYEDAEFYTEPEDLDGNQREGDSPRVIEAYLSLQNPLTVDVEKNETNYFDQNTSRLLDAMEDGEHDGIIVNGKDGSLYFVPAAEQIKSATDNTGAFDPSDPSIIREPGSEFETGQSDDDADIPVLDAQPFSAPSDTLVRRAVAKIADKFTVLKGVQEQIKQVAGDIPESADAYMAEELFHGKVENDIRLIQEQMVEPLARDMAEYEVSLEQLDEYLYAKHAPERNAVIAERNEEMPDGGSGMTDAEARGVIGRIEQSGKLGEYKMLADQVYRMLERRRSILQEAGLLDSDAIGAWEATYQNYVPLKGWAADESQDGRPRIGKGFAISGVESKIAGGRRSLSASPVAYAISDLSEAVLRHRKNEVGQTFLNLVREFPNDSYWKVYTEENPEVERKPVRVKDPATGKARIEVREQVVPMAMMSDRYFTVKEDGKTLYVKIEDERLMNAMRNVGPDVNGVLVRALGAVTRVMSSLNTSYNPEFVISNFSRDIQTALLNLTSEQTAEDGKIAGEKIAAKTLKDTGTAIRAINASLKGKALEGKAGEWQKHFDQFRADGAKTGWFDMKDIDGQVQDIEKLVKMASGGPISLNGLRRAFRWTTDWVENTNSAIENGVRLSAYVNAIDAGVSREKAASLAKNMTVNFNRRGELGTAINAVYMFANASVQGTNNFVRTLGRLNGRKGDPMWGRMNKAQKIAAGMAVSGFMLSLLNRLVAGDDDDEVNWWDKVPDYVKERNIVIMKSLVGGEPGEYWTIPLPYGYNIFPVMGAQAEHLLFSESQTAMDAASNVTLATLGSFSPIGFEQSEEAYGALIKNVTPTILRPVASISLNENFMGGPIFKENFPFGTPKPDSAMNFRSTPEMYKILAQSLNSATGGNEQMSGAVDLSPDVMRYLVGYYGGGAYDFFTNRSVNFVEKLSSPEELEDREIPFVRKLSGRVLPYEDQSKFYRRRDEINQIVSRREAITGRERVDFVRDYREKLRLKPIVDATEKRLSQLREQRDRIEGSRTLSEKAKIRRMEMVEQRMKKEIDRFNRLYNETD